MSNIDSLQIIYLACFHSVIKHGIIFGGNPVNRDRVFKLQKRIDRIMAGVESRSSCGKLFQKLDILPVPCQYIFSLIIFVTDNLGKLSD
jgi:hypothetical protein